MANKVTKKLPDVILFEEPGFKKRKTSQVKNDSVITERPASEDGTSNLFNIKKTRYEIIKFGISGFEKDKKYNDTVSLAIKLGAKPPKKEYKNYKTLIEERKKNKELEKKEKKSQISIQMLKRKKTTRKFKKNN